MKTGFSTCFVTYQERIMFHLNLDAVETKDYVAKKVQKEIKRRYAARPGQFIYLDYNLISEGDSVRVFPKNLFTALLLAEYEFPTTMEYPFETWKRFVVVYHPSCTGYFLL